MWVALTSDDKFIPCFSTECGKKKKGGPKGIKKKETASGGKVLIMRMSRNKRKSITVVTGLDSYPGEDSWNSGNRFLSQ